MKALKKESGVLRSIFNVSQVIPHTIGVTPTEFHSKKYGTVQLYDFAGDEEYHANHQLLFQNTPLPIILILTDLTLNEEEVFSNIRYWIKLLINSLTTDLNFKSSASIIIVGSHYDHIQGNKQVIIDKLESKIIKLVSDLLPEEIAYAKTLFCMNCQKPKSDGIDRLRAQIKLSCVLSRAEIVKLVPYKTSLMCQKVFDFINENLNAEVACTIDTLCSKANESNFTPEIVASEDEMLEYCKGLNYYGKMFLLRDHQYPLNSWIILKEEYILSQVQKTMKSLQSKSTCEIACGLVSFHQLQHEFLNELGITLKYLKYSQICTEVISKSFPIIPSLLLEDTYYFFPHLIEHSKPSLFKLLSAEDMTPFYCWQLVCHDPLTPRFLQVLLVQLTVPVPGAGDVVPPNYTVWKNGIHIRNNDTTESIIEVNSSSSQLLFSIRCEKNNESSLLTRRCQLINLILSTLTKNCPLIAYEEFMLQPQISYPIHSSAKKIALKKAVGALIEGRPNVVTYDGTQYLELAAVLCSDPIMYIGSISLKRLYLHPDDIIPPQTMQRLCMEVNIMKTWNSSQEITYKQLQERLSCRSVFVNRDIWVSSDNRINVNLVTVFYIH